MAKYRNKKNGRIATIVEEDKKYKTVLLEFEDSGEEQQISTSTLKRWWELVDEDDEDYDEEDEDLEEEDDEDEDSDDEQEEDEEEEDSEEDTEDEEDEEDDDSEDDEEDEEDEEEDDDESDEDTEEDDDESEDDDEVEDEEEDEQDEDETEEEEPAPKKKSKAKEKKPATPRKKSEENDDVKALVEYVEECVKEQDGEIFQPQSQPRNRAFKVGGHMYARLLYSVKAVTVACREEAVSKCGLKPTKTINHMFSQLYTYDKLDKTAKANIKKLLQASFDYQLKKNAGADKPKKEKVAPAKKEKAGKTSGKKSTKKEK